MPEPAAPAPIDQQRTPALLPPGLTGPAAAVAAGLIERGATVAVAESSAGGLISASLLSVPGASAYYLGGTVVYTGAARVLVADPSVVPPAGMRGATEQFAEHLARSVVARLGATFGVSETGATGPSGNPYGDPPGHAWVGVAGPDGVVRARRVETGQADRQANMVAFAAAALDLLGETLASFAGTSAR